MRSRILVRVMDSIGNNRGDISYTVGGLAWMVVGWVVALVYCMAYGWRFVYILKEAFTKCLSARFEKLSCHAICGQ
jgi:hypothetical protein